MSKATDVKRRTCGACGSRGRLVSVPLLVYGDGKEGSRRHLETTELCSKCSWLRNQLCWPGHLDPEVYAAWVKYRDTINEVNERFVTGKYKRSTAAIRRKLH